MYLDSDVSTVPMVSLAGDTTVAGGWNSADIGLPYSSGTNPVEFYVDDVVVGLYSDMSPGVHIGCGP